MWARLTFVGLALALAVTPARSAEPETYGEGVSLSDVTPIADVVERPADFAGKTVRVEGVVTAVCTHLGCWMALAETDTPGERTVLIKVDDGVIVFPVSAKGRRATAEGVVERVGTLDPEGQEAAAEYARQEGRAEAEDADDVIVWQIKATGAVVY